MGKVIVISGHSGAGKTTIAYEILKMISSVKKIVTCTTRKIRKGEKDGKDYKFVSKKQFEKWIKEKKLNEYKEYSGNYYGSLKEDVKKILDSGKNAMFVVETKGALTFKKRFENALIIFIKAPSLNELSQRLRNRGESEKVIEKRILEVVDELEREKYFDYIVINDKLSVAVEEVKKIIEKELKKWA